MAVYLSVLISTFFFFVSIEIECIRLYLPFADFLVYMTEAAKSFKEGDGTVVVTITRDSTAAGTLDVICYTADGSYVYTSIVMCRNSSSGRFDPAI